LNALYVEYAEPRTTAATTAATTATSTIVIVDPMQ